jgi:hypothetical protein
MPDHYKKFNTLVARPRVLTEIAFGIWKGRFPFFRCARMNIRSADDLHKLLGYIEVTLVIHKMFITTSRSEDLYIQLVSIANYIIICVLLCVAYCSHVGSVHAQRRALPSRCSAARR